MENLTQEPNSSRTTLSQKTNAARLRSILNAPIVNAILYLNKTGSQWRMLPKEFSPWQTVYDHYSNWNRCGLWEAALDELNVLYRKNGETPTSSYAISAAQSVKTASSCKVRGIGGSKKIKERKRHIVVDLLGRLIQVTIHAANVHDTVGGCGGLLCAARDKCPALWGFSAVQWNQSPPAGKDASPDAPAPFEPLAPVLPVNISSLCSQPHLHKSWSL